MPTINLVRDKVSLDSAVSWLEQAYAYERKSNMPFLSKSITEVVPTETTLA